MQGSTLHIVTELAEGGNLHDKLRRVGRAKTLLNEKLVWKYFIQTALGLYHIHARNILHRDVKCMNIFLTRNDDVKVGDLGVAKVLDSSLDMAQTMVHARPSTPKEPSAAPTSGRPPFPAPDASLCARRSARPTISRRSCARGGRTTTARTRGRSAACSSSCAPSGTNQTRRVHFAWWGAPQPPRRARGGATSTTSHCRPAAVSRLSGAPREQAPI